MSSIASRENTIMSKAGFNEFNDRSPMLDNPSNFGYPDIEGSFPDNSIPLSKLQYSQFDAVVDQNGGGTHLDIQSAIDDVNESGGGAIKINNGTYVLTDDIIVPSNISLIGEDKYNPIIDCNSSSHKIKTDTNTKRPSIKT